MSTVHTETSQLKLNEYNENAKHQASSKHAVWLLGSIDFTVVDAAQLRMLIYIVHVTNAITVNKATLLS